MNNKRIFAEDLLFNLFYCTHAEKIIALDAMLHNYLQRTDSIMGQQKQQINLNRFNDLCKEYQAFLAETENGAFYLEGYPAVYFMVMAYQYRSEYNRQGLPSPEFRKLVLEDIQDRGHFEQQMSAFLKNRKAWKMDLPAQEYYELLSYMRYLLDGKYTALRIRIKLIYCFASRFKNWKC